MSGESTADEVLQRLQANLGPRMLTSICMVATFIDPESGEENLYVHRDTFSPIWKHIGMVRSMQFDLEGILRNNIEDPDVWHDGDEGLPDA